MRISLIVNADDFGRTTEINSGIIHAFRNGIVSSASLLANFDAFDHAVQLAMIHSLPLGVHFNLTEGKPLCKPEAVPSLVDSQNRFFSRNTFFTRLLTGRIDERDLKAELAVQMDRCSNAVAQLDHYNGHHHIHLAPVVGRICRQIAEERGIGNRRTISRPASALSPGPALQQWISHTAGRIQQKDQVPRTFWGFELMTAKDKKQMLLEIGRRLKPGLNELMCHPGYVSREDVGAYNYQRFKELQALCDEQIKEYVQQHINLLSFTDLENVNAN